MEESVRGVSENAGSSESRPPNPLAGANLQCFAGVNAGNTPIRGTLVRHPSLGDPRARGYPLCGCRGRDITCTQPYPCNLCREAVSKIRTQDLTVPQEQPYRCAKARPLIHVMKKIPGIPVEPEVSGKKCEPEYLPIVRSGAWADIGFRKNMEDTYVCCDNFADEYGLNNTGDGPNAFYGVFDGHGGKHAADFVCNNLLRLIMEGGDFPKHIDKVITSAFLQADTAFAEACTIDSALASGTTALAALIVGRSLVVANAGDCRAVLSRRGKAIEMSRDHKPSCMREKKRIEATGGYVYDGYLNGQLNVARALGDWHMEGMKDADGLGPLSAEPEVMEMKLTEEDEFLIIGCDGIWDVFRSQNAVDFARRKLQEHNDPATCCRDLVDEALKRKSGDNLAVIVICFNSKPPPPFAAPKSRVQRSISAEGLKELQGFLDSLGNLI